MCITLPFHWVSTRPAEGRAIRLGVFVTLFRCGAGDKRISKTCVGHALISEHTVIGREPPGQGGVQALAYATLRGLSQGPLCFVG